MQAQIVRAMKAYVTLGGARDPAAARDGGGSDSDSWEEPVPADDGDNAVGNDDGDGGYDDGDDGYTHAPKRCSQERTRERNRVLRFSAPQAPEPPVPEDCLRAPIGASYQAKLGF